MGPMENSCDSKVSNARTLVEAPSENTLDLCEGYLVAKVPVVIAEPRIQIDVEADIQLDEPAIDIKRIRKNLYLTQAKLLSLDDCRYGKLFLGGFVRKNIEYSTMVGQSPNNNSLFGDIRHTTVKVPFECVAKVDFVHPLEVHGGQFAEEVAIVAREYDGCSPCEDYVIGKDPCQEVMKNYERFTERVFVELVDVKIIEADIHRNSVNLWSQMPSEQVFDSLIEKMVIHLKLKILQNQQIKLPTTGFEKDCGCDDKKDYGYGGKRYPRRRGYR